MNQEYEAVDFSSVLEQFANYAYSPRTVERIRRAAPLPNVLEMRQDLSRAKEAHAFLTKGKEVSLGGFSDLLALIEAAKKGITLRPQELLEVSFFLAACQSVSKAFSKEEEPLLYEIAQTIDPLKPLAQKIDGAIDLSGQVRMDATSKLRSLESGLIQAKADLSAAAKRFIKANSNSLVER